MLVCINFYFEMIGDYEYLLVMLSGLLGWYFWLRDDWIMLLVYCNRILDGIDNISVMIGLLFNQDLFILANNIGGIVGQFFVIEVFIFLLGVVGFFKLMQLDDEWGDYF